MEKFKDIGWKLFFVIIGLIFGVFIGFILFSVLFVADFNLDISIMTNIIIAIATLFATYIHYDSTIRQRKERIWEINKTILLELLDSLSQVINESSAALDEEYASQDPSYSGGRKSNPNVYSVFKEKQKYALEVYCVLMDEGLIEELKTAKLIEDRINKAVLEHETMDVVEAYEESIQSYITLQNNLRAFATDISGVRNT